MSGESFSIEHANRIWALIERRAERAVDQGSLAELVELDDSNPLFDTSSLVFFGRRGAGKTHTLLHLQRMVQQKGDVAVFVDMRKISSNASVYNDQNIAFGTRATNMLVDVVGEVHETLYGLAAMGGSEVLSSELSEIGPALDRLGEAVTQVRVEGESTVKTEFTARKTQSKSRDRSLTLAKASTVSATSGRVDEVGAEEVQMRQQVGRSAIYIHLGELDRALNQLVLALKGHRLWLLIDEWSAGVPYDLQPVLADMLRRSFISCPGVVVKIAAIEHRASFLRQARGVEYVGLELGADTAESLSLDSRLAIGSNPDPAFDFIRALLVEHFRASIPPDAGWSLRLDPITLSFASPVAFRWLVLASEGNPRDAINLMSKASRKARDKRITVEDVLRSAGDYFWTTKYKNIEGDKRLEELFSVFVNNSLSRGMRTVLFARSDSRRALVDLLYDKRLIHLVRSGLRSNDTGALFDVYAVDLGSYADRLISREMRWSNDGFANPLRFELDDRSGSWDAAVVRRQGSQTNSHRRRR